MDALEAIRAAVRDRQVVMVNEEHRYPAHRAFVHLMLPHLWDLGFRYLAVEALDDADQDIHARGYPTRRSGSYIGDPVFADLLRTALQLGFTLVPYEAAEPCQPDPGNPMSCQDARELGQARNLIARTLEQDPRARILVHVGRGHNAKVETEQLSMMAAHFRRLSGIDPLTIDQLESRKADPADESPLYRHVTSRWPFQQPVVLRRSDGRSLEKDGYDLVVFHPRAGLVDGRSDWLRMNGYRRPHAIDAVALGLPLRDGVLAVPSPVLIQALRPSEGEDAVPVDQIMVRPGEAVPSLLLPTGVHVIRAVDRDGRSLGLYEIVL